MISRASAADIVRYWGLLGATLFGTARRSSRMQLKPLKKRSAHDKIGRAAALAFCPDINMTISGA
jgi:hypothetical protein